MPESSADRVAAASTPDCAEISANISTPPKKRGSRRFDSRRLKKYMSVTIDGERHEILERNAGGLVLRHANTGAIVILPSANLRALLGARRLKSRAELKEAAGDA